MSSMLTLLLALALDDSVTVTLKDSKTKTIQTTGVVMASEIADLDDSTSVAFAYYFVAKDKIDPAALEKALKGVSGFKSVSVRGDRFYPIFEAEKLPTIGAVKKAVEVTEIAFAPAKDGFRWVCRKTKDAEHISAAAKDCCGEAMVREPASKVVEKKGG